MKLTNGVISEREARRISSKYVAYARGDFNKFEAVCTQFSKLKVGDDAITFSDGQFIRVKVSSIRKGFSDEPVVRVSNGEYSWRVDGDKYAYPIERRKR